MKHNSAMTRRIGRIMFIAVLFTTASPLYISDAGALPDTSVVVEPNASSAIVGDSFSLNLTVIDVQNLYGLEAILSWNSTVLALVNVEVQLGQDGGVLNAPIYIAENSTQGSRYIVAAASTNPAPSFNGTGNIVCLSFGVIGVGTCELDLQTQLYDYPPPDRDPRLSLPIAHADVDGLFQSAIPEFPSHLVFVVAAVLTLFSVALSKRISGRRNKASISQRKLGVCHE